MTSPTEACPVCAEPLAERPARCFRCETALGPWWAFEESLRAVPRAIRFPQRAWRVAVPALVVGALLGVGGMRVVRRVPPPPVAALPAPLPSPQAVPTVPAAASWLTYRVQRGDSRWRIAAALTGEGRRWPELWPEHAGSAGTLTAGTVLRLDLSRLLSR